MIKPLPPEVREDLLTRFKVSELPTRDLKSYTRGYLQVYFSLHPVDKPVPRQFTAQSPFKRA